MPEREIVIVSCFGFVAKQNSETGCEAVVCSHGHAAAFASVEKGNVSQSKRTRLIRRIRCRLLPHQVDVTKFVSFAPSSCNETRDDVTKFVSNYFFGDCTWSIISMVKIAPSLVNPDTHVMM